jgi:hypothetical protein
MITSYVSREILRGLVLTRKKRVNVTEEKGVEIKRNERQYLREKSPYQLA